MRLVQDVLDLESLSQGRLEIEVFGAGELVPALESFDAVDAGTAEMGHGAAYYWKGKDPNTLYFTSMPFSMTTPEQHAWFYYGGGMALMEKVYAKHGLLSFPGGNTGNQTVALIVRGLATGMFGAGNVRYLALKEIGIAAINGTMWGSVMGLITFLLYRDTGLAAVMGVATLLNLVVAAMVGTGVPLLLNRLGRDPAYGSSVLLTFTTDSMGFLIFLGLATVFLLG